MGKFKSYYGRRRPAWVKLVVVLLVLAVLAAVCFFVLPDFIVYTENGAYFDLSFLPWVGVRDNPSPLPSPSPSDDIQIIIQTPTDSLPPSLSPSPTITPAPTPPPSPKSYFVALTDAGNIPAITAVRDAAAQKGANSIVLEYKNGQGSILPDDIARAAITALGSGGMKVSALISVCLDNTIPLGPNTAWAVKHVSGTNWWDGTNRWINLHVPEARAYLVGTVKKALDLGFERVILQNLHFPYKGGVNKINYGVEAHDPVAAVDLFLTELRAACGESAPIDAVILEGTMTDGQQPVAGQSLESFERTFERLYVLLPEDAMSFDEEFIPIISTTDSQIDEKIAAAAQGYLVMGPPA